MIFQGLVLILFITKQEVELSHLGYQYYWQLPCSILKQVFFNLINFLKNLSKLCLMIFERKGNSLMSWRQFLMFSEDQLLYFQKICDLSLHQKPNYFDSSLIINYYNLNSIKIPWIVMLLLSYAFRMSLNLKIWDIYYPLII